MHRFLPARPAGRVDLCIAVLSLAALLLTRPSKSGDFQEYALMTIALAGHGTPDIRLPDVERAPALARNRLRRLSALAALPFKLIDSMGGKPFKACQVVNLTALAILTVALYRFTGSPRRAMFGTLFFLLSGGRRRARARGGGLPVPGCPTQDPVQYRFRASPCLPVRRRRPGRPGPGRRAPARWLALYRRSAGLRRGDPAGRHATLSTQARARLAAGRLQPGRAWVRMHYAN